MKIDYREVTRQSYERAKESCYKMFADSKDDAWLLALQDLEKAYNEEKDKNYPVGFKRFITESYFHHKNNQEGKTNA